MYGSPNVPEEPDEDMIATQQPPPGPSPFPGANAIPVATDSIVTLIVPPNIPDEPMTHSTKRPNPFLPASFAPTSKARPSQTPPRSDQPSMRSGGDVQSRAQISRLKDDDDDDLDF